jgi:hypothetical protein
MRASLLLLPLLIVLAGCRGTEPYSKQDLAQVNQAYAEIRPIYRAFEKAYFANDTPRILSYYAKEQRACHLVDEIDARDTIDPNVNLYQASFALDVFCNDIESAYAQWAIAHHRPYDKTVVPSLRDEAFKDGDDYMTNMSKWLKSPSHLA